MNVFYLDECPLKCADMHCHVHQNKMIIEYAQLLSTAHHVLDGDASIDGLYKLTHRNHPSAVWVRESSDHYDYVYELWVHLCINYTKRTGKTHATEKRLGDVIGRWPNNMSASVPFTEPTQCMPDEYKHDDTVTAYRQYMKAKLNEWQNREKPIKVIFDITPNWL